MYDKESFWGGTSSRDGENFGAESAWIYDQLAASSDLFGKNSGFFCFFSFCRDKEKGDDDLGLGINSIRRDDIARFLHMRLVDRLDVSLYYCFMPGFPLFM